MNELHKRDWCATCGKKIIGKNRKIWLGVPHHKHCGKLEYYTRDEIKGMFTTRLIPGGVLITGRN